MQELQGLNQVLRDEHQALQMAFAALEEKLRKAQDENRTLVERLIKYKAKDADKMNEENENFVNRPRNPTAFFLHTFGRVSFGKKGEKVRKELEEAARESGSRGSIGSAGSTADERILDSLPYYATVLPTKVALRFDAHDGEVNAVKWSPTDRIVATGGADRKVKLWDVSKIGVCECKGTLVGSNAGVMSVDFDSTGAYIVGASNDFASRVWTVADQRLRYDFTAQQSLARLRTAFNDEASHKTTIYNWFAEFNRGRVNLSSKFRNDRTSTAVNKNIDSARRMIETDGHVTHHEIRLTEPQKTDRDTWCNTVLTRSKEEA
ncbi:Autophagy-related protein 16-1 [Eumeta japonica]|uniref:Autophagy-related protein 16-1 n=1 Tax=Eumeta variegata TaxID=151549 RepID=A0A4C1WFL7_EUMVA|nr:Autophagy-related protein 16-1 [Eumeta japonica]